jgi:hypothetical protein
MTDFAVKTLMSDRVALPWRYVSNASQTQNNVQTFLKQKYEGRCILQGYVQPDSLIVHSLSMAELHGVDMQIDVNFSVNVLLPAQGDVLDNCVVDTISAAGLTCSYITDLPYSFLQVFVSRDIMLQSPDQALRKKFIELDLAAENKPIVRVTVQRCNFNIGDRLISVLATLDDIKYSAEPQPLPALLNIYTPKLKKPKYQGPVVRETQAPLAYERQAITTKIKLPSKSGERAELQPF